MDVNMKMLAVPNTWKLSKKYIYYFVAGQTGFSPNLTHQRPYK
jgi:hypothetical protein